MQRTAAQSGKTGRKIVVKSESNLVTRSVHLVEGKLTTKVVQ